MVKEMIEKMVKPKINITTDDDIYFNLSIEQMESIISEYVKDDCKEDNIDQIIQSVKYPNTKVSESTSKLNKLYKNNIRPVGCTLIVGEKRYEDISMTDMRTIIYQATQKHQDIEEVTQTVIALNKKEQELQQELANITKAINNTQEEVHRFENTIKMCKEDLESFRHARTALQQSENDRQILSLAQQAVLEDKELIKLVKEQTGIVITTNSINIHRLIQSQRERELAKVEDFKPKTSFVWLDDLIKQEPKLKKLKDLYNKEAEHNNKYKYITHITLTDIESKEAIIIALYKRTTVDLKDAKDRNHELKEEKLDTIRALKDTQSEQQALKPKSNAPVVPTAPASL